MFDGNLRHLFAAHSSDAHDLVVACTAKCKYTGYGVLNGLGNGPESLRLKLKDPAWMLTVFMAGKGDAEWNTLALTMEHEAIASCGVVVGTNAPAVWERLAGFPSIRYVYNVSGQPFNGWTALFPKMDGTRKFGDFAHREVGELLNLQARAEYLLRSAPEPASAAQLPYV